MSDLALNRITNYQSSFVIDSRLAKDSFNFICNELMKWIRKHELRFDAKFNTRKFAGLRPDFANGKVDVRFPSKSSLKTSRCVCDDRLLWGMEYVHTEISKKTGMLVRFWHTEVYMTSYFNGEKGSANNGSAEKLVLYIKVSYSWNRNKFLEEEDARAPEPTAPGFVYDLLPLAPHQDGFAFPFKKEVLLVDKADDGEKLWQLLNASQRRIRILIIVMQVSTVEKAKMAFLKKIGSRIVGKTVAFLVPPSSDAFKVLRDLGLDIMPTNAYICPPLSQEGLRPQYVKIGDNATEELLEHLNERLCQFFYQNNFYVEDDALTSLEEIRIEILKQERKRMIARHMQERTRLTEDTTRDYDALKAKYEVVDKERADAYAEWIAEEDRRKGVEKELAAKRKELLDLHRLKDSEWAKWERERKRLASSKDEFFESEITRLSCKRLKDIVGLYVPMLGDRLVFTAKAIKSLDDCPADMERFVLPALFVLHRRFWVALGNSSGLGERLGALVEDLPFAYTSNESNLTKTTHEYAKARTVTYDGREYVCFKHLKLKRGDGRIYFEYDDKLRKIILCSIGPHLDTAGTRRRGH